MSALPHYRAGARSPGFPWRVELAEVLDEDLTLSNPRTVYRTGSGFRAWHKALDLVRPENPAAVIRARDLRNTLVVIRDPARTLDGDRRLEFTALGDEAPELVRRLTILARLPLGSIHLR